ncbi:hypothetical protein MTR67_000824 [Solanum verrucosum]|uniref:Tf2-1-like SH3-like domain-containing protein n=1 Tax=Solanum verrucosum TaxID=315347 RepID=A0AAF0PM26_SOLVR|nr:hypothetical protein MTR67_000824 [Solanum verrucosum]
MIKVFTLDVYALLDQEQVYLLESILAERVYRDCVISINHKNSMADLIELDMVDFDVILGMDWLHACYASIDCRTRVVRFQIPNEPVIEWSSNSAMLKELEFEVDDWVYLKVSPMKGVMRFGKKGKLSPRYIGPYRISKRIDNVAYELELPQELATVHPVSHISMLKKCMGDPSLIIPTEDIGIKDSLSYEEIPIQILDCQVLKLRTKEVASVKKGLGSKVNLSTAFHPQIDRQAERTIQTLDDMLKACVIDFKGN